MLYVASAVSALAIIGRSPPAWIEWLCSAWAAPLFFLFQPLYPLFAGFGWIEGEWWRLPTPTGFVVGTVIYAAALWAATRLAAKAWS